MTARFAVGASTHPGMVRDANEDAFVAEDGLFVVADGMGGHQAGEVASAIAVQTMREAHQAGLRSADDLVRAVQRANDAIRSAAGGSRDHAGMGTTLTGFAVLEPAPAPTADEPGDGRGDAGRTTLAVANVGDSRTYLWRNRRLSLITLDHSYVQDLVTNGQITEQEARLHPRRNIVTRALGIDSGVRVDTWLLPAVRGDRFVVCSDGLVDEVPDHEIATLLDAVSDPQTAAENLVAIANRHGGRDNITVIVVDVVEGDELPADSLPDEPVWAEGLPEVATWADQRTDGAAATGAVRGAGGDADPTAVLPVTGRAATPATTQRRPPRFGVAQLLFLIALGVIVMVVAVVVALAVTNDSPTEPTPTTVPTTLAPTSTVGSTTTTTRPPTSSTTRPRASTTTVRASPTTVPPRTTAAPRTTAP